MLVHKYTLALKDIETIGAIDTIKPEPPTGTIVTTAANGQISFSGLIASVSNDVIGYNVYYRAVGGSYSKVNNALLSFGVLAGYTVSGLTNGQQYEFYFTAVDTSGNESLPSNTVTGTPFNATLDTVAPSPPAPSGSFTATPGINSVQLQGMGPSPSIDTIGYNAYYDSGAGAVKHNVSMLTAAQIQDYVVTGLSVIVEYSFWFTALDAAGNESLPSTALLATPLEGASEYPILFASEFASEFP